MRASDGWDVIVVGGGLGGALAAAILGRRGCRVLLLEKEARLGGRLRSFEHEGFVLDAGAFLWPNRHLDAALREAGASDFRASTVPETQLMRLFVQGTGGKRYAFPWPGRSPSARLSEAAEVALAAPPDTYAALHEVCARLAALPQNEADALSGRSMGEALVDLVPDSRVRGALLRNVMLFGTYDPAAAPMGQILRLLGRDEGLAPPPRAECPGANPCGGIRALPQALDAALGRAGVVVRPRCEVEQIAFAGRRVDGVWAHGPSPFRERLRAAVVVCNVPIWTFFRIAPENLFPDRFVADAERFRAVGGTVNSAFAFRALPRLRETGGEDVFPGWTRLLVGPGRGFGGGMLWTTRHSPHNAPPGAHVLQAMRLSPRADLADHRRVEAISRAFRAMLDEIYLDVDDVLLWSRSWTTRDGSEYLVCSARRPPVRAPSVEGLYFVGETTDVPAVQMDAAALSALRCADEVSPSARGPVDP